MEEGTSNQNETPSVVSKEPVLVSEDDSQITPEETHTNETLDDQGKNTLPEKMEPISINFPEQDYS